MPIDELPVAFKKYTGIPLDACYSLYTQFKAVNQELFQKYPEYFEVTPDIKPILKLKPEKVRNGKYPITFPKEYFMQEMHKYQGKPGNDKGAGEAAVPMSDTVYIVVDDS